MSNAKLGIKCVCGATAIVIGGEPRRRKCLCKTCGKRFAVVKDVPQPEPIPKGIPAGRITIGAGFRWGSTRLG